MFGISASDGSKALKTDSPLLIASDHPLKESSDADCHSTMMAERSVLIQAKREEEQSTIKHIITLSSGSIALFSGIVFSKDTNFDRFQSKWVFFVGILFMITCLTLCLTEQLISAYAYEKQISINQNYYSKLRPMVKNPFSLYLKVLIMIVMVMFVVGLASLSSFLILNA